jgi:ferredoxin
VIIAVDRSKCDEALEVAREAVEMCPTEPLGIV